MNTNSNEAFKKVKPHILSHAEAVAEVIKNMPGGRGNGSDAVAQAGNGPNATKTETRLSDACRRGLLIRTEVDTLNKSNNLSAEFAYVEDIGNARYLAKVAAAKYDLKHAHEVVASAQKLVAKRQKQLASLTEVHGA